MSSTNNNCLILQFVSLRDRIKQANCLPSRGLLFDEQKQLINHLFLSIIVCLNFLQSLTALL